VQTIQMTHDDITARLGRFDRLQPMEFMKNDATVSQAAKDIILARKLMPVVLERTQSPFGNDAPIYDAAGLTMFISIMPPGQGPCLHAHVKTFETFIVLSKLAPFTPEEIQSARTLNGQYQQRVILLTARELEPYWIYDRTKAELGIDLHGSRPEDLAQATDTIYFRNR